MRALVVLAFLALVASAAGHGGVPEVHVVATGDPGRPFGFLPDVARLAGGQRLEWTNDAGVEHTATADDGSFDVVLAPGATGSAEFPEAGSFAYGCRFHPAMRGAVEVFADVPAAAPLAVLALALFLALVRKP